MGRLLEHAPLLAEPLLSLHQLVRGLVEAVLELVHALLHRLELDLQVVLRRESRGREEEPAERCERSDDRSPHHWNLLSCACQRDLYANGQPALRVIGDISCDVEGGVEVTVKATEPDDPIYVVDPETGEIASGFEGH